MKKHISFIALLVGFYLIFGFLLFSCDCLVHAQPPMKNHSLVFRWDKNPDVNPDTQAKTTGYNIYYSNNPDNLTFETFDYGQSTSTRINTEDIPQPSPDESTVTYTWIDVPEGDYYFVCTAHNQNGVESKPSNIVHRLVDYHEPNPPEGFNILISITVKESK